MSWSTNNDCIVINSIPTVLPNSVHLVAEYNILMAYFSRL